MNRIVVPYGICLALLITHGGIMFAQEQKPGNQSSPEYLTQAEVDDALKNASAQKHETKLTDFASSFKLIGNANNAQAKRNGSIRLFMPDSWIAFRRDAAKKEYKPFSPVSGDGDTLRAVTVAAMGMTMATNAGPACRSVERVALIANKSDTVAVEALGHDDGTVTLQNAFGATASCTVMLAKFSLSDVKRVESTAKDGDFIVMVFYSDGSSKQYTIGNSRRKDLGL